MEKEVKNKKINEEIENWWNRNTFSYGVAKNNFKKFDQVGSVDFDKIDLFFFSELDRKFEKHLKVNFNDFLTENFQINELKNKNILDIACGSGIFTVKFAKISKNVEAIDLTENAVKLTKIHLKLLGLDALVKKMDAQNLKFKNNSFDFVNAWGCLMHMPNTQKAINEIYRCSKKNSKTLAYFYNKNSWTFWFSIFFLRGILMLGFFKYGFDSTKLVTRFTDGQTQGGNILTKVYSKKQLKKMYSKAGFDQIKVDNLYIDGYADRLPAIKFPIFKFLPKKIKDYLSKKLSWGLIVKAHKY